MTFTDWFFDGIKLKYKSKYPEAKEGERPIGAEVMQPSKEELESKGEEQIFTKSPGAIEKERNKTALERETQETLRKLMHNQNLIIRKQILNQEKLESLDEKLIEIIKMLMGIKDRL